MDGGQTWPWGRAQHFLCMKGQSDHILCYSHSRHLFLDQSLHVNWMNKNQNQNPVLYLSLQNRPGSSGNNVSLWPRPSTVCFFLALRWFCSLADLLTLSFRGRLISSGLHRINRPAVFQSVKSKTAFSLWSVCEWQRYLSTYYWSTHATQWLVAAHCETSTNRKPG